MQRQNFLQGSWQPLIILFSVALSIIIIDQLTKLWVRVNLLLGESQPEEGLLRITRRANEGGVFGVSFPQPLTLYLPVLVVIAALVLYYRYFRTGSRLMKIGFGLVIGGSIGNLIDRFRLGYVTDFIDIKLWNDYHWPVFNVADAAIVGGTIIIIFFVLRMINSLE